MPARRARGGARGPTLAGADVDLAELLVHAVLKERSRPLRGEGERDGVDRARAALRAMRLTCRALRAGAEAAVQRKLASARGQAVTALSPRRWPPTEPERAFVEGLRPASIRLSNAALRGATRVGGLAGLSWLTALDLSSCESLEDVSVLGSLNALTALDLSLCRSLEDVSGLGSLTGLTSLNLSFCWSLKDVPALRDRLPAACRVSL